MGRPRKTFEPQVHEITLYMRLPGPAWNTAPVPPVWCKFICAGVPSGLSWRVDNVSATTPIPQQSRERMASLKRALAVALTLKVGVPIMAFADDVVDLGGEPQSRP